MIIPAGPHKLWVAFFYKENAREMETEDEVARDVDCYPIIAWSLDEADDGHLPRPISQAGVLKPKEQMRVIGDDKHKVREEAVEKALQIWRTAEMHRASVQAALPVADDDDKE